MKYSLSVLALTMVAYAQPKISQIVSSADLHSPAPIDGLGTVKGEGLALDTIAAPGFPLPFMLGSAQVALCPSMNSPDAQCNALQLLYASAAQINFYTGTKAGSALRVTVNGVSTTTPYTFFFFAPIIFEMGYDCSFDPADKDSSPCGLSPTKRGDKQVMRGAITDAATGILVTSEHPMRPNRDYSIWLTGLGSIANPVEREKEFIVVGVDLIPAYGYSGTTSSVADISYAGPSSFPGLNQINIRLPHFLMGGSPGGYNPFPCADYKLELAMSVQGRSGISSVYMNFVNVPVFVQKGDVPCVQ